MKKLNKYIVGISICLLCNSYVFATAISMSDIGNSVISNPYWRPSNYAGAILEDADTWEAKAIDFNVNLGLCKPWKIKLWWSDITILRSTKWCNVKISNSKESILCDTMKNTKLETFFSDTIDNNFENCDNDKRVKLQKWNADIKILMRNTMKKGCEETQKMFDELKMINDDATCIAINKSNNYSDFDVILRESLFTTKEEKALFDQREKSITNFKNRCNIQNMIKSREHINFQNLWFTPDLSKIGIINRSSLQNFTYSIYSYPFYKKENIIENSTWGVVNIYDTKKKHYFYE